MEKVAIPKTLTGNISQREQSESMVFAARLLKQAGRGGSEFELVRSAFDLHASEGSWTAYFWAAMRCLDIAIAAECEALLETLAGADPQRWAWIAKIRGNRAQYEEVRREQRRQFRAWREGHSEAPIDCTPAAARLPFDPDAAVVGFWAGPSSTQQKREVIAACELLREEGRNLQLLMLHTPHDTAEDKTPYDGRDWVIEASFDGQGDTAALVDRMDVMVWLPGNPATPVATGHFRLSMAHAFGKPTLVPDLAPHSAGGGAEALVFPFEAGYPQSLASALKEAMASNVDEPAGPLDRKQHAQAVTRALQTLPSAQDPSTPAFGGLQAGDLRAISIMDEISAECWRHELTLHPVSRSGYAEQVANSRADFCFLESCWKGNGGKWEYAFTSPGLKHANAQALLDLIPRVKKVMPLVFWNKEDPMHYDRFLPIAKHADIIFTTDSNKVPDYERDVPGADVYAVPFAAQQKICNPADRFRKEAETVCFAGSYYSVGHDERKRQMDALLPSIIPFNGAIYDRMSKVDSDRYKFPEQYTPFIRDAVPFTKVVQLYKSFKVFLNVNTIIDSPTMMSRRVYELLACGTPVVSTPSRAIEEQFDGIVQVAGDAQEANTIIERLLSDSLFWAKTSHAGYREVMTKHTYAMRINDVARALGIDVEPREPLVSIVTCTRRPHMIDRIVDNMARQKHANCELLLVLQDFTPQQREELLGKLQARAGSLKRIEVIVNDNPDITLGERFNSAVAKAAGEYIAKMDDDDFYFEHYLSDMLIPFSFGDYAMVGKQELFMYLSGSDKLIKRFSGMQHREVDFVAGPTFVIKTSVFRQIGFRARNTGEDSTFLKELRQAGHRIYAADPYNFVQFRADPAKHTWGISDEEIISAKKTSVVADGFKSDLVRL